jgi:hypothetical protein
MLLRFGFMIAEKRELLAYDGNFFGILFYFFLVA